MHFEIHDHPFPQMTLQKKFLGRQNLANKVAVFFDQDWTGAGDFPFLQAPKLDHGFQQR